MKTNHVQKVFVSDFSRKKHRRGLENIAGQEAPDIHICSHNAYCTVRRIKGENFCLNPDMINCQTYKFYDRYKDRVYI